MSEINLSILLDGLTLTLHKSYPNSPVYGEDIPQGLKPCAFGVKLVTAGQQALGPARYKQTPTFDVRYFPKAGKVECYAIADQLFAVLEVITLPSGDKLRGTDMSFEVVDGVLHFHVNYAHLIRHDGATIMMENLKLR